MYKYRGRYGAGDDSLNRADYSNYRVRQAGHLNLIKYDEVMATKIVVVKNALVCCKPLMGCILAEQYGIAVQYATLNREKTKRPHIWLINNLFMIFDHTMI